ncbi:MAG: dynein gamma chain protein [Raoultibacter sp.]
MNTNQFKSMLEQMDDQIALNRRWVHKMFHSADEAGYAETAKTIKEAQSLLDDVRALLTDAQDALEKDGSAASGVTVELV